MPPQNNRRPKSPFRFWGKSVALLVVVSLAAVGSIQLQEALTLNSLVEREAELRALQTQHPTLVLAGAFLLYVAVTAFSLPGATVLSLLFAWYFRFWTALPLVSFASTLGATLAFLISRYLLRDWVQSRFGNRQAIFNESLERDGPFFLFTLRLIPAVPFFLINIVMGLTPIKARTFWWISQLGMLPGTIVYLLAGSSVPTLRELAEQGTSGILTPKLWIAIGLLAVFPFIARRTLQIVRPNSNGSAVPDPAAQSLDGESEPRQA